MATPIEHKQISEQFLHQAEQGFERGDALQASEKGWGAVVHYVKSVAKERGMRHDRHRHINDAATELISYLDDPASATGKLNSANVLHSNFYEGHMNADQVRVGIASARELIDDLKVAESRMP